MLKELESYGTKSGTPCAKLRISDCGEVIPKVESSSRASSSIKSSTVDSSCAQSAEVISSEPVLSAEGKRRKAEKDAARKVLQESILTASEQVRGVVAHRSLEYPFTVY